MTEVTTYVPAEAPQPAAAHAQEDDPVIWRADLHARLHVSSETVRRWIKANKLPAPDVDLSLRTRGWKLSTLRAAGISL